MKGSPNLLENVFTVFGGIFENDKTINIWILFSNKRREQLDKIVSTLKSVKDKSVI